MNPSDATTWPEAAMFLGAMALAAWYFWCVTRR